MAGFYEAVRRYILQSVSTTFQTLSKASLAQSLKSDGTSLDNLVSQSPASRGHCNLLAVFDQAARHDCLDMSSLLAFIFRLLLLLLWLQIADKIASDGWNIGEDNVIRFPKRGVQRVQQVQRVQRVQFEKLVPVLKLAA